MLERSHPVIPDCRCRRIHRVRVRDHVRDIGNDRKRNLAVVEVEAAGERIMTSICLGKTDEPIREESAKVCRGFSFCGFLVEIRHSHIIFECVDAVLHLVQIVL